MPAGPEAPAAAASSCSVLPREGKGGTAARKAARRLGSGQGTPRLLRAQPLSPLTLSHCSHRAVSWSSRASIPGPLPSRAAVAIPALPPPSSGGGDLTLPAGSGEAEAGAERTDREPAGSLRKMTRSARGHASLQFTCAPLGVAGEKGVGSRVESFLSCLKGP